MPFYPAPLCRFRDYSATHSGLPPKVADLSRDTYFTHPGIATLTAFIVLAFRREARLRSNPLHQADVWRFAGCAGGHWGSKPHGPVR